MDKRPAILIILDGWGYRQEVEGNAIAQARTPTMDRLMARHPHILMRASGEAVGLPNGQMGNSEVGHLNLGAGRIVYQDIIRIFKAIKDGTFFANRSLVEVMEKVKRQGSSLHLLGLLSDGGVHSHQEHLYALLKMAKERGVERCFVHAILDGRDTSPHGGLGYMEALLTKMKEIGIGQVATVAGRYYTMDRDNRWERVHKAYRAMVLGEGRRAHCPLEAISFAYRSDESDEFVLPTVVVDQENHPVTTMKDGDGIIFFNFRADRARQITRALLEPSFDRFPRGKAPQVSFVTMTLYEVDFGLPVVFEPISLEEILGEMCSRWGLRQLRIAETEKYAHVTYFFNGGREEPYEGEDRILIPSPPVETYDKKPEMSAFEVTEKVVELLGKGVYDLVVLNYANADMVGHTGIMEAAIRAIEAVDTCLGKVLRKVEEVGGVAIITGDHGNAEQMVDLERNEPHTAHTCNPVPLFLFNGDKKRLREQHEGMLCDVAPTLIHLMGRPKPKLMEGNCLIVEEGC